MGPFEWTMQFGGDEESCIMHCLGQIKHSRKGGRAEPGIKPICGSLLPEIEHGIVPKCHTRVMYIFIKYQRQASDRTG